VSWLFAGAFALAALLAYLSPLGLAPLVGLLGLACLAAERARLPRSVVLAAGGLLLWAAVSLAWSPIRPWLTAKGPVSALEHITLLEIVLFALAALLASGAARKLHAERSARVVRSLRWSMLALAVMLVVDSLAGGRIYAVLHALVEPPGPADFSQVWAARGGYVLAVLMWPWLAGLNGRARWLAPAPFLTVAAVTVLLHQDAPLLALIAGSAAFALVLAAGTRGLAIVGALHAAFWLATPWILRAVLPALDARLASGAIKPSWTVRLKIWRFAGDRIAEHPIRGWGMDASRAFGDSIPLHTHDWSLQVWLELGLPGAILAAALWLAILGYARRLPNRVQRAAAAGGISAYLVIGAVSFGLWQPWWLAVGVLAVLAQIVVSRSEAL
jgi:O-antigen ligase